MKILARVSEMVRFVKRLGVVLMLCLVFAKPAYAEPLLTKMDLAGGSTRVTWEDASRSLDEALRQTYNFYKYRHEYKKDDAKKDLNYIAIICLTHKKPYRIYKQYEDKFLKLIKELDFDLERYDIDLYEERLYATRKLMDVGEETEQELLAFSGFNYKLDSLPFNNLSFSDARKDGVCVGMVYYELYNYLSQEILKNLSFKFLRTKIDRSDTTYGPLLSVSANIDASDDEVFEDRLYHYEPMDIKLRSNVVTNSMESWEEKQFATNDLVELYDLERGSCDDNIVRSVYWLWGWGNLICNQQIDAMIENEEFMWEIPVITGNMINVIEEELKASKPISIMIGRATGSRHAVLGYKLTQDVNDPDIYYLHVVDSNYPGNYASDGKEHEFKIVLCKGTYQGEDALYYMYAPARYITNSNIQYMQGLILSDYNGIVLNRSIQTDTWGKIVRDGKQKASKEYTLDFDLSGISDLYGEYFAPNYFGLEVKARSGSYVKTKHEDL